MPIADIVVPQMGEGLREVRIVALSKQPGDAVRRDETIYTMETDKALLEVESPFDGTLIEWLANVEDVLEIGTPVARIDTSESVSGGTNSESNANASTTRNGAGAQNSRQAADVIIPPRTRKYGKDLGINDAEMRSITAPSGKLMPADVDAYLAAGDADKAQSSTGATVAARSPADSTSGIERDLSPQQRLFNYRARRSAQMVIPVTIGRAVAWSAIADLAAKKSEGSGEHHVTEFQAFAYFAARSAAKFPKLRSVILSDEKRREYPHINLGVAVARDNGDLLTALLLDADTLQFYDFVASLRDRIHDAREGHDQATPDMQFVLTYLGKHGATEGAPLLIAPAVGILFIGAVYSADGVPTANIALTFDHRLINGAEAAEFLADLAAGVETAQGQGLETPG